MTKKNLNSFGNEKPNSMFVKLSLALKHSNLKIPKFKKAYFIVGFLVNIDKYCELKQKVLRTDSIFELLLNLQKDVSKDNIEIYLVQVSDNDYIFIGMFDPVELFQNPYILDAIEIHRNPFSESQLTQIYPAGKGSDN